MVLTEAGAATLKMAELFKSFMELPGYIEYSPTFPNPLICIRDMLITGVRETIDRLPWNGVGQWLEETWDWMSLTLCLSWDVLVVPLLLAVLFTLLRVTLNHAILYVSSGRSVWLVFILEVLHPNIDVLLLGCRQTSLLNRIHCAKFYLHISFFFFLLCTAYPKMVQV